MNPELEFLPDYLSVRKCKMCGNIFNRRYASGVKYVLKQHRTDSAYMVGECTSCGHSWKEKTYEDSKFKEELDPLRARKDINNLIVFSNFIIFVFSMFSFFIALQDTSSNKYYYMEFSSLIIFIIVMLTNHIIFKLFTKSHSSYFIERYSNESDKED